MTEPTTDPMLELLAEEDKLIRDAMKEDYFGGGDKLAVIVKSSKGGGAQYSFHGAYLPEELRAETPQEIGGFVRYKISHSRYGDSIDRMSLEGGFSSVRGLTYRETYGIYVDYEYSSLEFGDDSESDSLDVGALADNSSEEAQMINKWLEEEVPPMLQDEKLLIQMVRLNDPTQTVEFGDGQSFVGYCEDTGEYTMY